MRNDERRRNRASCRWRSELDRVDVPFENCTRVTLPSASWEYSVRPEIESVTTAMKPAALNVNGTKSRT
jgi:hypothetical protein